MLIILNEDNKNGKIIILFQVNLTVLQDLNKKLCPGTGRPCDQSAQPSSQSTLDSPQLRKLELNLKNNCWHRPLTLNQLQELMKKYTQKKVKLVAGNTGAGWYLAIISIVIHLYVHVCYFVFKMHCANVGNHNYLYVCTYCFFVFNCSNFQKRRYLRCNLWYQLCIRTLQDWGK